MSDELLGTAMRDADEAAELHLCTVAALGTEGLLGVSEKLEKSGWRCKLFKSKKLPFVCVAKVWNPAQGGDPPEHGCVFYGASIYRETALIRACGDMLNRCCRSRGFDDLPTVGPDFECRGPVETKR